MITGFSSGIGRETTYRFAHQGARLVLTYDWEKAGTADRIDVSQTELREHASYPA